LGTANFLVTVAESSSFKGPAHAVDVQAEFSVGEAEAFGFFVVFAFLCGGCYFCCAGGGDHYDAVDVGDLASD
jgi:hypothetical protein